MVLLVALSPPSSLALPDTFGVSVVSLLQLEVSACSCKEDLLSHNPTNGFWSLEMEK